MLFCWLDTIFTEPLRWVDILRCSVQLELSETWRLQSKLFWVTFHCCVRFSIHLTMLLWGTLKFIINKGLFTYYVSQFRRFSDPPSPPRPQSSAFGRPPLSKYSRKTLFLILNNNGILVVYNRKANMKQSWLNLSLLHTSLAFLTHFLHF